MFDLETPVDRTGTQSLKWERYGGRDVIPMWVADLDLPSPPAVVDALHRRAAHGVFGYTLPPPELTAVIVERFSDRHGWEVDPSWIVYLPGLVVGLNVACRAVGSPGDEVATFTPIYPPFLTAPGLSGRGLVTASLREAGGRWEPDWDALAAALTPHTRLVLWCSPDRKSVG